ncbi:MAG: gamma-glutamyl-gamma-aminobutyrate hydrolase family protein [Actinomycetes bacterium]
MSKSDEVVAAGASGRPLVAVFASLTFPGMDRHLAGVVAQLTSTALATLSDVGARPWLVDLSAPQLPSDATLARADGLVLLGGGDLDPQLYGFDGPVDNGYGIDRRVDEYSIDAVRSAMDADQPVLGICRGVQVLNVACGGTLHPDVANWALHRGASHDDLFIDEHIRIAADSTLAGWAQTTDLIVRTGHHQAVHLVGEDLVAVAWADDGIVEAVEHRSRRAVGVQWHPEQESASHEDRHRMFAAFVRSLG